MVAETGATDRAAQVEATTRRLLRVVDDMAQATRGPGTRPAGLDDALDRDLGFDSLARVELTLRLEEAFGVALAETVVTTAETPRDLVRAVLGAAGPRAVTAQPLIERLAAGVDLPVPQDATTLVEVLDWHARRHGDRLHVRFYADQGDGTTLTFGALREAAGRVAAGLIGRGLEPGGAVAIMLPTGADYFAAFFGALIAGGVAVPVYPPGRPTQIEDHLRRHARILANARAQVLVTVPEALAFARGLKAQADALRAVVTTDELEGDAAASGPAPAAGNVALLQYTSGSTGNPKGVVLTHANLLANIRAMGAVLEAGPEDTFVSWLPLYHDMGLIGAWLGSLHYGMPLVLMSPLQFLGRPQRWLWAIHRHRGTLTAAPNFAYEICRSRIPDEALRGLDLSSWRMAANGAEAVSPETVEGFCRRFAPFGFRRQAMMPMYGLAECSVGLALSPLDRGPVIDRIKRRTFMTEGRAVPAGEGDEKALRVVGCGRPLPGHEIRVVDAADRELPERRQGAIQFRGPSATSGYFRNAGETARLFHGDWLDSGDLGYIADGEAFVTGRAKDLIIRGGRNVYPAELEEAIGAVDGIRKGNVAVFGGTDPATATERLVVLAETRRTRAVEIDELRARVNAVCVDLIDMPPDQVVLAPPNTVPKTSSGKIRRAASRAIVEGGLVGRRRPAVWWQVTRLALASVAPALRRVGRGVAEALYGAWFWAALGLIGVLVWPAVAVLPGQALRWAVMRAGARAFLAAVGLRPRMHGLEHLPPDGEACVFVTNHASYLDGPLLVAAIPRRFAFVAKVELAGQVVAGVFLKRIGALFVERFDRETSAKDARLVTEAARAGHSPMVFPEGTCLRMPGLLPFHLGAFAAAAETGRALVPITIRGTRSVLRPDQWRARSGIITVTVDAPIAPAPASGASAWTEAVRLRDAARALILRRSGEPDLARERPFAAVT